MGKFKKKKSKPVIKTRKEIRKEKRQQKKVKRNEYYNKKNAKKDEDKNENKKKLVKNFPQENTFDLINKERQKAEREKQRLEKDMKKRRNKQLLEANAGEDKMIKRLEKQLKLDKRKSSVAKTFAGDGLDYILEMCDAETRKDVAKTAQNFADSGSDDEFGEDFAVATGKITGKEKERKTTKDKKLSQQEIDVASEDDFPDEDCGSEENFESMDYEDDSNESDSEPDLKRKKNDDEQSGEDLDLDEDFNSDGDSDENSVPEKKTGEWEDIYGRKRDKEGNVIEPSTQSKYIPPALRNQNNDNEATLRLKKQIKGQLNRLTEANLISISQQIENFYTSGKYSRNILNSTFCELIDSALVTYPLCPKQTVADHALLIALLHANVDIEIGANFLQHIVEKYNQILKAKYEVENKELENCVHIISALYNLKVFHCGLIHDILRNLLDDGLSEQNIESILLVLKTVGPVLRKDDPSTLKDTLLYIQNIISNAPENVRQSARLKFMSDILMAIKNNNFTKIPNYSHDDVEHFRKVLRGAVRKGNYVTELNITLDDLLNVAERGKWWVVGSAWTGKKSDNMESKDETQQSESTGYSEHLLELARQQRMNTDTRRNIFCILMTAEDYLDAFEKLLHLGLRGQQEREIVNVLFHCCLQEKTFNPYYAVLAKRFCDYERRYQIAIQCSIWDKLKDIKNFPTNKIRNFSKFVTHLFIEGGLALSVLKVINLGELDKPLLRFLRQTLLGVLLNDDIESVKRVLERAGGNPNFKQGLRLFVHHFLLRGNVIQALSEKDQILIKERAKIADKLLLIKEKRVTF